MSNGTQLPLDGIRIIDLTQVMMGPCATQALADFGADVIKIERPGAGDLSRGSIEPTPGNVDNPVFCSLNRNKRSVTLDLRGEAGQAVVRDLVREADVIVNNFRPGVMERLNLGYESLKAINPRIIYASGSGFGSSGPNVHKGGQDVLAQAVTGVMARKQDEHHPTAVYATALCDYTAGMHMVQGILAAIIGRGRTGEGQVIEVSLYDSMLAMQMQEAAMQLMQGKDLNWAAMPLSGVFETTDRPVVLVGAFKQNPLRDICAALEIEDLSLRYPDLPSQRKAKDELQARFRAAFAGNSSAYWLARLEEQDLLCAPVRTLAEALDDPQTDHNGMVVEAKHPSMGAIRLVGSPVHMSAAPLTIRYAPPALGADTEAVLAEAGYSEERIRELRSGGVLG
ncbi:CaiB/BaiF CoA transferase family protein [Oceanibacterium hippocampi]|uniref:Formyl-coenzyme A transferase n=1 Tax=Oceanibacterium hippocampi TaxID=745714 RepID=A0A1Y5SMX3_9PROT|nr:CoA transferase [Oceanibacterium hippocampi]SLN43263.1 Formyl-coenzyme A transferase [Oceanibacterium hippocampi]